MATPLNVFSIEFENATRKFIQEQANDALLTGLDAKALVQLRVQNTGIDYLGNPFDGYSTPYAMKRQDAGRQDKHVDMTFRGHFWNNTKPRIIDQKGGVVTVRLGPDNPTDQAKLDGQVKKRGNMLLLSKDEVRILTDSYTRRRLRHLTIIQ